jgi:hypothetical protein
MKKGLLVVAAVLMLASVAQSGEIKNTTWPCTFTAIKLFSFPVKMDIGYYVRVKNQQNISIKLDQSADSMTTYTGCTTFSIEANFNAIFTATVAKYADAGKDVWGSDTSASVTLGDPAGTQGSSFTVAGPTPTGGTPVKVCVTLTKVYLGQVAGNTKNVHVADVTINVKPDVSYSWPS